MKFHHLIMAAILLSSAAAGLSAEDGAATYKKRCAACHGASGEGKPAMKAPAINSTKLDADQVASRVLKGEPASKPPHNKAMAGLTEDQATAVAAYVKGLK
jgi:mono/diheme cytochrome c family protein